MPWLSEAMKDVVSCDKLRVTANKCQSVDLRMGQPGMLKTYHSSNGELTQGTDTSKYLVENKVI